MRMKGNDQNFIRANGLSLVLLALFLMFLVGQAWSGFLANNQELLEAGRAPEALQQYLASGHFIGATFENWESEFLQMGMYVLLTVSLRQKGSAESRPLRPEEEEERIDAGPTPWPARAGGLLRTLYAHSLSLAFLLLFAVSFVGHLYGSWMHENEQRLQDGEAAISWPEHLRSAQFWFESLQNWQSEFLAVLAIVVLSIWLRQDKSPESKALEAPHSQTGT